MSVNISCEQILAIFDISKKSPQDEFSSGRYAGLAPEIKAALEIIGEDNLILCHTTSSYPCPPEELNLRMVQTLRDMTTTCPIGYSGHAVGLVPSAVAVALGACLVERHITLDRAMWGSDQSASVEPQGLASLVKYIRVTERSLGDGIKRVYDSELSSLSKLRRFSQ